MYKNKKMYYCSNSIDIFFLNLKYFENFLLSILLIVLFFLLFLFLVKTLTQEEDCGGRGSLRQGKG